MKSKISQIRQEVKRLNSLGRTEEAKKLWKQGVILMYKGDVIDDEIISNRSTKDNNGR